MFAETRAGPGFHPQHGKKEGAREEGEREGAGITAVCNNSKK